MPATWYPGATKNPGAAANYQLGHNTVQCCKCHYTVGVDSTGIGLNGYFQFLISRDGAVQQFAPVDALCYDSGEANATGPGIEIEYLPGVDADVFTAAARASCEALVKWLAAEWSIPLVYHDGDHDTDPGTYAGFLSHKSIIQTEEHQDFWPQADWDLMTAAPPAPPFPDILEGDDMICSCVGPDGTVHAFAVGTDLYVYYSALDPKTHAWSKAVSIMGQVGAPKPK